MIKYILPLPLAALTLTGCLSSGYLPNDLFQDGLDRLKYDQALSVFEYYATVNKISPEKEFGDILVKNPTLGSISS